MTDHDETDPIEDDELEVVQVDEPIPGLEAPPRSASPLELATRRTIASLVDAGLVDERHSMITRLMLDLAIVVDAGRRDGKASAAAMAAAQILAAYAVLVPPETGGGDSGDAFDGLAHDLRQAAERVRRDVAG